MSQMQEIQYKIVYEIEEYGPIRGYNDKLAAWKNHALSRGDLPREYLTPRIICGQSQKEFEFISRPITIPSVEMQEEIGRLAPWTYHVEVPGATTIGHNTYNEGTIRFHRYRANLICNTVAQMLGSDLTTSTFLDIGCNCGFFTLEMAARGAFHVMGLDFRQENIEQAKFLKRAFGVSSSDFSTQNVKDLEDDGHLFDVVLNLGLMYHLSTPFEILRSCYLSTKQFCVIDTISHTEPISAYHVQMKDPNISIEGDLSFELQPTYRGILDTIKAAGFGEVVEIVAPTDDIELYDSASRRCLVAFKESSEPYLARLRNSHTGGLGA